MINRTSNISLSRQAELLGFSRGMVYYEPKPISKASLALMHAIDRLHMAHPFMGARMLRNQLQRDGFVVGRQHSTHAHAAHGHSCHLPQTKKYQ